MSVLAYSDVMAKVDLYVWWLQVEVRVMCLDGTRDLIFKSARSCACYHCKKDWVLLFLYFYDNFPLAFINVMGFDSVEWKYEKEWMRYYKLQSKHWTLTCQQIYKNTKAHIQKESL